MKNLKKILLFIMIITVSVLTLSGCGLFGSEMSELNQTQEEQAARIKQLEDQIALLLLQSGEGQSEAIADLENEMGSLREQLMDMGIDTTADIIARVMDSVVAISVYAVRGNTSAMTSLGTGFFIQQGGYIATNSHVITPETGYTVSSVTIYMSDRTTTTQASIVADFPDIDIAILKASGLSSVNAVTFNTETPVAGTRVIAIGTPIELELMFTSTAGIVSANNRSAYTSSSTHEFCIQHDAAINPGNSGGPLFNMSGHVVGVNTMGMTDYEAIGFAIEPSAIKAIQGGIARSILSSKTIYTVPSLKVQVTDSVLDATNPLGTGVFVDTGVKIYKRLTGANTNLKVGTIITKIDNKAINTRKEFYEAILGKDSGDTAVITVSSGATYTITL